MLEQLKDWRGNLEKLIEQAEKVSSELELKDNTEISVRMVRDYIQRGILRDVDRSGRELEFSYPHLLKLVLSRVLLSDGWSLKKIGEHFCGSCVCGSRRVRYCKGNDKGRKAD